VEDIPLLTERVIRDLEANTIRAALAASRGKIYGEDGAAAIASRIKSLGIDR